MTTQGTARRLTTAIEQLAEVIDSDPLISVQCETIAGGSDDGNSDTVEIYFYLDGNRTGIPLILETD